MNIKICSALLVLFSAFPLSKFVQAANAKIVPVQVSTNIGNNDVVGQQLAFEIKETIRKSSGYRLVSNNTVPRLILRLSSISFNDSSQLTEYSVVFTVYAGKGQDIYMNDMIGYCGSSRVVGCARTILGSLDTILQSYAQIKE
jgi:hypothetical protein